MKSTIAGDRPSLTTAAPGRAPSGTFSRSGVLPKVITYVLCEDLLVRTDAQATVWLPEVFEPERLRTLGPLIKQMRVHYVAENATTNFSARVTSAWSVLGKSWSAVSEVLSAQTGTQTGVIGGWFTTDSAFGLLMRYSLEIKSSSGTAIESGRVTVVLEIELKS